MHQLAVRKRGVGARRGEASNKKRSSDHPKRSSRITRSTKTFPSFLPYDFSLPISESSWHAKTQTSKFSSAEARLHALTLGAALAVVFACLVFPLRDFSPFLSLDVVVWRSVLVMERGLSVSSFCGDHSVAEERRIEGAPFTDRCPIMLAWASLPKGLKTLEYQCEYELACRGPVSTSRRRGIPSSTSRSCLLGHGSAGRRSTRSTGGSGVCASIVRPTRRRLYGTIHPHGKP